MMIIAGAVQCSGLGPEFLHMLFALNLAPAPHGAVYKRWDQRCSELSQLERGELALSWSLLPGKPACCGTRVPGRARLNGTDHAGSLWPWKPL